MTWIETSREPDFVIEMCDHEGSVVVVDDLFGKPGMRCVECRMAWQEGNVGIGPYWRRRNLMPEVSASYADLTPDGPSIVTRR